MNKKNTKLLINKICNEIIPNNTKYARKGVIVYLNKNHLEINYKEKTYIIYIIKNNNFNYWYIKSSYNFRFITTATRNFDYIINIIKNNTLKINRNRKLLNRKRNLNNIIMKSDYFNKNILIDLINDDCLNSVISQINNIPTIDTNNSCLVKNGFLTGEEQFISLLTFLTIRIIENFNFLKIDKLKLVSSIIYENKNYKFLLAKKYIGNNDNIPYYQKNIRKFIIDGFLENAYELINESKIINDFFLNEKIKLSDKIQDTRKIQKIILLLQKLAYANKEESEVILLFKNMNHLKLSTTDKFQLRTNYKHAWENIINNYKKNNNKMEKDNLYI